MILKKIDPFIVLLLAMILVAWGWPMLGVQRTWINPSEIAGWGVGAVFFFYGLKLSGQKLKAGLTNFRLHAVVHLATFVLFPLLVLPFMHGRSDDVLWLGVFFVAALPSTVSSSVVMVSMAKGNVPAAIFNASVSSLAGVFLTPLWMSIYLNASDSGAPLGDVVLKLVLQVLVPVGVGMLLNKYGGRWADSHKKMLRWFDQTVILAIVWTAFCEGFAGGMFQAVSWSVLLWLSAGMVTLFFTVYGVIWVVCGLLKFNREDRITALFCGSKKSLVHGTVMSKVLVRDATMVGVLLLPIMIYHALQLIIVSWIAQDMSKKA